MMALSPWNSITMRAAALTGGALLLNISPGNASPAPQCIRIGDCGFKCGLYLAKSTQGNHLGLYSGIDRVSGDVIQENEMRVPIFDHNMNEWSPLEDFMWLPESTLESNFFQHVFAPGIASLATCAPDSLTNMGSDPSHRTVDSLGIHRATHPTAGSFTYNVGYSYQAVDDINAGDELFASCKLGDPPDDTEHTHFPPKRTMEWLNENAVCIDTLSVDKSTLDGVGRGAFTEQPLFAGEVIATSPVLHFDRSQLQMVRQKYNDKQIVPDIREHGIEYSAEVIHQQLLLNYCFGHPESNILLLPFAPGVNFINHNRKKANAYIRWSSDLSKLDYMHSLTPYELLDEPAVLGDHQLVIEYIAMKDIDEGDEIFLDYGDLWVDAWNRHEAEWTKGDEDYASADDYNRAHPDDMVRTAVEQASKPYPPNIVTACDYVHDAGSNRDKILWRKMEMPCYRFCDITERHVVDGNKTFYDAVVHGREGVAHEEHCGELPDAGVTVLSIPADAVDLVDRPYTTDMHLRNGFRQEIGVPDSFYPRPWMKKDPKPNGDFIPTPLGPGDMEVIRWADTGFVVTPHAYRIGLPPSIRKVLLEYCNKMGITDILRHITLNGNALKAGRESFLTLDGEKWYLQRPEKKWNSNLQWLSPGDNPAHEHYLQALSVAGFDEVLAAIGKHLKLSHLVAFHVTFIGVSHSTRGYMHHDVTNTQGKTFNCIIPLLLANETGPELDLQNYDPDEEEETADSRRVGRYRYEYDVASMLGDDATHATSAMDYRAQGEMRMAATVYVAEVTEENADQILKEYTQAYPPDDRALLLSWAGGHWRKDDPSVSLPHPNPDHILVRDAPSEEL